MKRRARKWVFSFVVACPVLAAVIVVVFSVYIAIIGTTDRISETCIPSGTIGVSEQVTQWQDVISTHAQTYEIEAYIPLISAIMMQESGGRGLDPMQASESGLNTKYPQRPNGITDPFYSIEIGVQVIKNILELTNMPAPNDTVGLSLMLQSYNFGSGFISYANERGGYSLPVALDFSIFMAEKMGWRKYGDPEYVPHVLRYYSIESSGGCTDSEMDSDAPYSEYVIDIANQQLGKSYVWGASGPDTFDCSGLVYFVYNAAGFPVPRLTAEAYMYMSTLTNTPARGDLVFFKDGTGYIFHIGIYIGNDEMIHAPNSRDVVKVSSIRTGYYKERIAGYGKINLN